MRLGLAARLGLRLRSLGAIALPRVPPLRAERSGNGTAASAQAVNAAGQAPDGTETSGSDTQDKAHGAIRFYEP